VLLLYRVQTNIIIIIINNIIIIITYTGLQFLHRSILSGILVIHYCNVLNTIINMFNR